MRDWLLTALFSALFVAVPVAFLLVLSSGGGSSDSSAVASGEATEVLRARDEERQVSFRLKGRKLTMTVAHRGDDTRRALRGKHVRLSCGYDGRRGFTLYNRRMRWSTDGRRKSLNLPPDVAAGVEFCAVERDNRTLARVVFAGP